MFKKGQLVRHWAARNIFVVNRAAANFDNSYWVTSIFSGREYLMPRTSLTLIGNNYKEKPRDAIQERRDSYK